MHTRDGFCVWAVVHGLVCACLGMAWRRFVHLVCNSSRGKAGRGAAQYR